MVSFSTELDAVCVCVRETENKNTWRTMGIEIQVLYVYLCVCECVHEQASPRRPTGERIIDTFRISMLFQQVCHAGYRVSGQIEMSDCIANLW